MVEFQLGQTGTGLDTFFRILQVFAVCFVDVVIQHETVSHALEVRICNADLSNDPDRLSVVAGIFSIDLLGIAAGTHDLLRELEQVVCSTDPDFHPAGVVKEAVGAVGEIKVHAHVREHHDDGLVQFHHVDVTGHINFIEFRSIEQSNLFLNFDGGQIEHRGHIHIEHGGVHNDICAAGKTEESAEFSTAVVIAAGIVGQTLFHVNEAAGFIECPERVDVLLLCHFADQFIAGLALVEQIVGDGDRFLSGSDLEVNADNIQLQVLGSSAGTLFADQGAVIRLYGVGGSQTEVHKAECQVDIQVVDIAFSGSGVVVSGATFRNRFAAGSGSIVTMAVVVGNRKFRKHTHRFGDHLIAGDFFFKLGNLDVQVVFHGEADALFQLELMLFIKLAPAGLFPMLDCGDRTVAGIIFLSLTACQSGKTGKHDTSHC